MAAEAESGGERTEEPSQRRLQEARERGQLPRSRELTNFATMIGGSAALMAISGTVAAKMSQMMRRSLSIDANALLQSFIDLFHVIAYMGFPSLLLVLLFQKTRSGPATPVH